MRKLTIGPLLAAVAVSGLGTSSSDAKTTAVPAAWKTLYQAIHAKPAVVKSTSGQVKSTNYSGSSLSASAMQMMRNQNPQLFDRMFPALGKLLVKDTQIRIAQAQGVTPTNGLLPNTALYNYLEYRRSLNPARFDYYHPVLGPILAENQQIQTQTNPTPPPKGEIIPPPTGGGGDGGNDGGNPGSPGTEPPQGEVVTPPDTPPPAQIFPVPPPPDVPPPAAVPEPGSILLMLAGGGLLGLARARQVRKARETADA
jgi:hypothetical protein